MWALSEIARYKGFLNQSQGQRRRHVGTAGRRDLRPSATARYLRFAAVLAMILVFVATIAIRVSAGAADRRALALAAAQADETRPTGEVPVVTRVDLKTLTTSGEAQVIPVVGDHFAPGMSVRLFGPMEVMTTFPPSALEGLTPKSFAVRTTLDEPGTYTLAVRNKDGALSNTVTIAVKKGRE